MPHQTRTLSEVPFLPYPLRVTPAAGLMTWPQNRTAFWYGDTTQDLSIIRDDLARSGRNRLAPVSAAGRAGMGLVLGEAGPGPDRLPSGRSPESYRLCITRQGLSLRARAHEGLIRGWQTVRQILDTCGRCLPAGTVDDAPALTLRGFHLDLKGLKPTPSYLLELPDRLARFKINTLLLELEDYVRFRKHPSIAHAHALAPAFWKTFAARAQACCLEIVPLVQTWGHLHYILRVPRYRHLSETRTGMIGEICPLHPESWPLIRDLIDEICDLFPNSRYLHVGLDEVHARGQCPRCRRRVATVGMQRFVIEQINQRFDYVVARGKIPMFWGSVDSGMFTDQEFRLIHNPLTLSSPQGPCQARAVGLSGNYSMTGPEALSCSFAGGLGADLTLRKHAGLLEQYPDSDICRRTLKDLSPELRRRARRYAVSTRTGLMKPAYELAILKDHGFDTIAISAAQYSAGIMGLCPDFVHRQRNEWATAQWAKSQGALGMVDTWWARGHSHVRNNAPFEAAWYGIASTADFAWRPAAQTLIEDLDRRWCRLFLGVAGTEATDALYAFSMSARRLSHVSRNLTQPARDMWQAAGRHMTRQFLFRDVVDLGMEAHQLALRVQHLQLETEYLFATLNRIPTSFRRGCQNRLRELSRDLRRFAGRLRRVLRPMIIPADIEELVRAEVVLRLKQLSHLTVLLRTPATFS